MGQLAHLFHSVKVGVHVLLHGSDTVFQLAADSAHQLAETLDVFLPGRSDLQQTCHLYKANIALDRAL